MKIAFYVMINVLFKKRVSSMGLTISKAYPLMSEALNYRAVRQDLIASNIANVDTPFYKARDISFANTLIAKKRKVFNDGSDKTLQMAHTSDASLDITTPPATSAAQAALFLRNTQPGNDGNNVDIDKETTELSKNAIAYNALIAAIKKDQMIYTDVIDASGKLS
jgi:flagellar basal-body rod protein FlgB